MDNRGSVNQGKKILTINLAAFLPVDKVLDQDFMVFVPIDLIMQSTF